MIADTSAGPSPLKSPAPAIADPKKSAPGHIVFALGLNPTAARECLERVRRWLKIALAHALPP
jgi:hypothetical protein